MAADDDFVTQMFTRMNIKACEAINRKKTAFQEHMQWLNDLHKSIVESTNHDHPLLPKTPVPKTKKRRAVLSSSEEETASNVTSQAVDTESSMMSTGKPKRNASKMASMKINEQAHIKMNSKLRRPGSIDKHNPLGLISASENLIAVKVEQHLEPSKDAPEPAVSDTAKENMPPPAYKPKRGRKKIKSELVEPAASETEITRSSRPRRHVKKEQAEDKSTVQVALPEKPPVRSTRNQRRPDSDVVIQEVPVPVYTISDDDDSQPVKASSALSGAQNNAEDRTDGPTDTESEDPPKKAQGKKKRKPVKRDGKPVANKSVYEDALPHPATNTEEQEGSEGAGKQSATEEVQPSSRHMDCTVTIEQCSGLDSTQGIQRQIACLLSPDTRQSALNSTHVVDKSKQSLQTQQLLEVAGINPNCTVVLDKLSSPATAHSGDTVAMNKTVVLSPKGKGWQKKENLVLPALLTDDDDSIEVGSKQQTPAKKPADAKKTAKSKPMFSPYANSPVKKRVAAFEQLGGGTADAQPVTRVTRTKTKLLAEKTGSEVAARSKYVTPATSKQLPSLVPHTDTRHQRRMYDASMVASELPTRCATAVKPSRAEELRRREEREAEVRRKKEALLQAKADEQKRKREEKQLKALRAREQLEREKEDKLKQLLQEKEDRRLEELQQKREWAARRAADAEERRRLEEQQRLARLREQEAKVREQEARKKQEEARRAQFNQKPPPLPTEDGDDSDSSSESAKPKCQGPVWGQKTYLVPRLLAMRHVPKGFIETFFQMQATTPDLREIFETVDERTLRRNSSAVWRTPPRYSTLPRF